MRLYRHDLRHYLNSVTALIREGKVDEALQILDHFDDLTTPTRKRYCQNTTVNAVLSFYLAKAEQAGILVDACCELPQQLPVDAIELSVVLANAIENACQALAALPPGQEKKLTLRCVGGPPLVLEIANPYCGKIAFDQNHLPCAERQGHGFGTRSIATFAKNHHALLDYQAKEGIFRLRLLVNDETNAGPEQTPASVRGNAG